MPLTFTIYRRKEGVKGDRPRNSFVSNSCKNTDITVLSVT